MSALFILSNKDEEEVRGIDMVSDPSLRLAAPLMLNPPAGISSRSIVLSTGVTDCLISLRLLDGVGGVEEPFVVANRLSNEGGPSALPKLFLAFFVDRDESSATLSRLLDAVLGPANVACWAPRIAIPDSGCMSVRSARGRVGAFNRRADGGSVIGRAGRECIPVSTSGLLAGVPLVFLGLVVVAAGGLLLSLDGASSCSNRKQRDVERKTGMKKLPTANPDESLNAVNSILVLSHGLPLSVTLYIIKR
jgi:hypothetical protein